MRRRYVKPADIARAKRVAKFVGHEWSARVVHATRKTAVYDAIFVMEDRVRVADIRARNVLLLTHKTLFADAKKADNLMALCRKYAKPDAPCTPVIVFLLLDALVWVNARKYNRRGNLQGRRDRGDSRDMTESVEFETTRVRVLTRDKNVLNRLWGTDA